MYRLIDESGNVYVQYKYTQEAEFEKMVVANVDHIFGKEGIYFDLKKLIGKPKKGAAIPDGYYLDLTFHSDPRLYLVEVELTSHDVYGHIGNQILRFGISSEMDKYNIKRILLNAILADDKKQAKLNEFFKHTTFNNNSELLDKVIFDKKPMAVVVIDDATEELYNVMGQLTMSVDVLEVQTFVCGSQKIHRFTPFKEDILTDLASDEDVDELDTIVVPAREDGFVEEFVNNNRWFAIRIASAMLDKIKYIAAYQVAPVSGITHIAEVERIEKYNDTNKYIVYFKFDTTVKIDKIGLGAKKGLAPQAPRYSAYKTIMRAKTLDDLWE